MWVEITIKQNSWKDRIKVLNKLYDEGNYIIYFTARAMGKIVIFYSIAAKKAEEVLFELTKQQLDDMGLNTMS